MADREANARAMGAGFAYTLIAFGDTLRRSETYLIAERPDLTLVETFEELRKQPRANHRASWSAHASRGLYNLQAEPTPKR